MLIKSKAFWITTVLFLLISGGIGWFVFPRLYHTYQEQSAQVATLDSQIETETTYITTVKNLAKQEKTIDDLYQTANNLLPATSQNDLLALQLDGLVSSLGLTGFSVTVPLSGSAAVSQPAVRGAAATGVDQSITLAGPASFAQLENLLASLRTFSRWNTVSSVEINQSGTSTSVSVAANVFNRSVAPAEFTGRNGNLLTEAATLFNEFKSYVTAPNVATEGEFGRSDPFASSK